MEPVVYRYRNICAGSARPDRPGGLYFSVLDHRGGQGRRSYRDRNGVSVASRDV